MIIFYVVYPYDKDLKDIASRLTQNGSRWLDAALDSGGYQPDHEADTPQDRDADEDDLYAAMDCLIKRQDHIEKKLAVRHLESNGLALYDLTSSYFEGITCPCSSWRTCIRAPWMTPGLPSWKAAALFSAPRLSPPPSTK